MQRGGASAIWDALYSTVEVLDEVSGSRTILLISDGRASRNVHSFHDALERARRSNVTVHVAALDARFNRELNKDRPGDPTERLRTLARSTGGEYAEPELKDLPEASAKLLKKRGGI